MMSFTSRLGCCAGLLGAAWLTGCATPGPPRAPSLHLPAVVKGMTAERRGDVVLLRFVVPERTTLNEPITGPVTAALCRQVEDGACAATSSYPGKVSVTGEVEWTDALPADVSAGAARRIGYRVEVFNTAGRGAGPSQPVWAAGGAAPGGVGQFRAEGSRGGVTLRWTPDAAANGDVLVKREALGGSAAERAAVTKQKSALTAAKGSGKNKSLSLAPVTKADAAGVVWLHASGSDAGGMIDATIVPETPYRYTAVRSREVTLAGRRLEMRSAFSEPVTVTLHDVFPPAVPQGLLAAGYSGTEGVAVDLVWQPNTESDLAGYNVYRQTLGADGSLAAAVKLNGALLTVPAFHDATAARGTGYRYAVTAVDAKGNESARSGGSDVAAAP